MGGAVVWLEGEVSREELGERAAGFAGLASAELPVPRGFALGRTWFDRYAARVRGQTAKDLAPPLPQEMRRAIAEAFRALGGSAAIRRSPLGSRSESSSPLGSRSESTTMTRAASPTPGASLPSGTRPRRGGRPDRETYLHLTTAADVAEAVRRLWSRACVASEPLAILVQAFVAADASAVAHRDPTDPQILQVEATFGVGDLLAAGLVVADRYAVRIGDGAVLSRRVGRKAQMSLPHEDGGLRRLPVPSSRARSAALDDTAVATIASLWSRAELAVGPLEAVSVAFASGAPTITAFVPRPRSAGDALMLG